VNVKQEHECWIWDGNIFPKTGYGNFGYLSGRSMLAHRYSFMLHYGEIPKGMCVCHKCDNKLCVNPKHLFLGTQRDNINDKVLKNRQAKGTTHGMAKLSEEDVYEILRLYSNKMTKIDISKRFNVSYDLIKKITRRELWRYLPYENRMDV
jgi:hypothetical protein